MAEVLYKVEISPGQDSNSEYNKEVKDNHAYQEEFLYDWTLICMRIENGIKLTEQVKTALQERVTLEEMYSVGLEKISSNFFPPATESSSMASAVKALRSETLRRAQQCRELSETLRLDILNNTLNQMLDNHRLVYSSLHETGCKLSGELQNKYLQFIKFRNEYALAYNYIGKLTNKYQNEKDKHEKSDIIMIANEIIKRSCYTSYIEEKYIESIDNLNKFREFYEAETKKVLNILESMDSKRLLCLRDVFMKTIIYDMSYIRNLQYDSDNVIKALEAIDISSDMQEYVGRFGKSSKTSCKSNEAYTHSNITTRKSWAEIVSELDSFNSSDNKIDDELDYSLNNKDSIKGSFDLHTLVSSFVGQDAAIKAQKVAKLIFSQMNILGDNPNLLEDNCRNIYNSNLELSHVNSTEGPNTSLESLSTNFSTCTIQTESKKLDLQGNSANSEYPTIYKTFINKVLNSVLIVEISENISDNLIDEIKKLEQLDYGFRVTHNRCWFSNFLLKAVQEHDCKVIINTDDQTKTYITKFIDIIMMLLTCCQDSKDIWTFRIIVNISSKIIIDRKELTHIIYHHEIWDTVKFWEDSLILCIAEDFQFNCIKTKKLTDNLDDDLYNQEIEQFKQNNYCWLELNNFAMTMKSFGIPDISIITLFTKICGYYNLEKPYCDKLLEKLKCKE
ncbi:uncharacterized protein CMU_039720 [Cryptosporidium muris RN66]|uniref:FCH domain-containing protein n=1 Tax=Cryptosporidium muris (strain RN66) TaxID=441375 RepID=B6A9L2_CRYMR|nr:uncharacterized protein CMU_039720 [Cryptosporidium muris RN66]EEA04903.1 hypothetical protein, conserved [Cryptosporidium muris RN66]|eukprot:XP_002139252.1 hypothetical protein [Cryptosporidium muris RN66]